jgi:hypothetical protein
MQQTIPRQLGTWVLALTLVLTATPAAEGRAVPAKQRPDNAPAAAVDAATRHHHPDVIQPPTRIVTVAARDTFDWRDAGVGAGGALGAVLLAAGSVSIFARTRHGTVSPSSVWARSSNSGRKVKT